MFGRGGRGGEGGPSTCPGDKAMRGLSLLLVLFLVQRALFPGIRSCPLLNNEHIQIQIRVRARVGARAEPQVYLRVTHCLKYAARR